MYNFICLVLCFVAVDFSSVYAGEEGPANMEDVFNIMDECAKENEVTIQEMQAVTISKDVKTVNPCLWSCVLKKTGFLDDKGQYVLNPGLKYVKNIVKKNDVEYKHLENIAKECESVKEMEVSDGEAGCEMGALVTTCFIEQYELELKKPTISKR